MEYRIIRPVDILHLRGNRLFADAGHGEAVMPPWPSVFAGALRSRILSDRNVSFQNFRVGRVRDDEVARVVGPDPSHPGSFRITATALVGPHPPNHGSSGSHEPDDSTLYFPCPADLAPLADEDGESLDLVPLVPVATAGVAVSTRTHLPRSPVLRTPGLAKPVPGVWLTLRGMMAHLRGDTVPASEAVRAGALWKSDPRLGIALSSATRTARTGLLYTTEAVAFGRDVGFFLACEGADGLVPDGGLLRLGGDGRGASIELWPGGLPEGGFPWNHRPNGRAFRMILATPGCFPGGWLPAGVTREGDRHLLRIEGLTAQLVAAAVPRAEVVSGWDLAENRPKPAVRVVPVGAVYWFEVLEGDLHPLEHLVADGFWPSGEDGAPSLATRRAEGFGNVWLGEWHHENSS